MHKAISFQGLEICFTPCHEQIIDSSCSHPETSQKIHFHSACFSLIQAMSFIRQLFNRKSRPLWERGLGSKQWSSNHKPTETHFLLLSLWFFHYLLQHKPTLCLSKGLTLLGEWGVVVVVLNLTPRPPDSFLEVSLNLAPGVLVSHSCFLSSPQ